MYGKMKKQAEIYFLRHGETDVNTSGLIHQIDDKTGLNTEGRRQAKEAARFFSDKHLTQIYSSPEARAVETAEIIGQQVGLAVSTVAGFRERDWGEWAYKSWNEVQAVLDKMDFGTRYSFVPPMGESAMRVEERLRVTLAILDRAQGPVLIVTHAGVLKYIVPILKEEPMKKGLGYDFENISLTVFKKSKGKFRLLAMNQPFGRCQKKG